MLPNLMEHPRECRQTMIGQNYTGDYDLDYDNFQRRSDETVARCSPPLGSQFCIKSLASRILLLFPLPTCSALHCVGRRFCSENSIFYCKDVARRAFAPGLPNF